MEGVYPNIYELDSSEPARLSGRGWTSGYQLHKRSGMSAILGKIYLLDSSGKMYVQK